MFRPLRSLILATLPLVLLVAIIGWFHREDFALDASTNSLIAGDQRSRQLIDKVNAMLPKETPVGILIDMPDIESLYSDAGNLLIASLCRDLSRIRGCVDLKSVTHAGYPKIGFKTVFGVKIPQPEIVGFFPDQLGVPPEQWELIREELGQHPMCRNIFLADNDTLTLAVAMFDRDLSTWEAKRNLREDVKAIIAPYRDKVKQMEVISFPTAELEVVETVASDAIKFFIAFFIIAGLVILVTFRSPTILFLILIYQVLGLASLGLVFALNGHAVNVYSLILVPLVAGLQLTFLTHFFAAFQSAVKVGASGAVALRAALREVLRPSLIAALTTAIGLLALQACHVKMVKQFGFIGAQAVLLLFLVTFGPALFARLFNRPKLGNIEIKTTKESWVPSPLLAAPSRPLIALFVGIAILIAFVPAAFRLSTDMRAAEMLSPDSEARRCFDLINNRLGGTFVFQVDIHTGVANGIQERPVLEYMERLRHETKAIPGVSDAYAYSQLFTALNQQFMEEPKNFETLPEGGRYDMCKKILSILGQKLLFLEQVQDRNASRGSFYLRTADMPAADYLNIIDQFLELAEKDKPAGITLDAKAGIHTILSADRDIVRSQVNTLWISAGLMFLALALLWLSPWLGFLAILANVPALASMLGIMGYTGIALNSVTVMVGAIILGIAVDDAVHFLDFHMRSRKRIPDRQEAVRWTLAHKFKPMACTTVILLSCFALFLFSSFPPIRNFGILAGTALVVAFTGALLILPAILARGALAFTSSQAK